MATELFRTHHPKEAELNRIHKYICYNPTQWETDQENPGWG